MVDRNVRLGFVYLTQSNRMTKQNDAIQHAIRMIRAMQAITFNLTYKSSVSRSSKELCDTSLDAFKSAISSCEMEVEMGIGITNFHCHKSVA